jgi:nucleotide-binding universal stress UspA family protein
MSFAAAALIWAGIVIVSMVIVAYFAVRWGRDPFGWALLAAVLGPIAAVGLIGSRQSDVRRPTTYDGEARGAAAPTILLACDGSAATTRAARYVAAMHRPDVDVLLLTVLPHEAQPGAAFAGAPGEHERRVEHATGEAERILREAGVRVRIIPGYGSPAEEILRCAEQEHVEAIIVGRRGAGLTRALLGSVSERVVDEAKQPVVVVE